MREVTLERNTSKRPDQADPESGRLPGRYGVDTGCGFLNHMLDVATMAGLTWCSPATGMWVDYHHTAEDIGIALGRRPNFARRHGRDAGASSTDHGSFYLPMDEALVLCAVDLSGRCPELGCPLQDQKRWAISVMECASGSWLGLPAECAPLRSTGPVAGKIPTHPRSHASGGRPRTAAAVAIDTALGQRCPSTKGTAEALIASSVPGVERKPVQPALS